MSELASAMKKMPQVMEGVEADARGKQLLATDDEIRGVIRDVQDRLGESGRVLVRASGTEPLIRVMLEGNDLEAITAYCKEISDVIKNRIAQ